MSLERNHQRKEEKSDATGVKHTKAERDRNSTKFDCVEVDTGYGFLDPAWLLDEGH